MLPAESAPVPPPAPMPPVPADAGSNGAAPGLGLALAQDAPGTADIAGFWRRFLALVVDGFVLLAIGWALGRLLTLFFMPGSVAGPLLGVGFLLTYDALLTGPVGRGRTPGKALLGIRVAGPDGGVPGLAAAWRRALVRNAGFVVGLLGTLVTMLLPRPPDDALPGTGWQMLGAAMLALMVAPGIVDTYRYLLDDLGRQSLHDRLAGTWVVRATSRGRPVASPFWRGHYVIAGGLALAVGAGVFGIFHALFGVVARNGGVNRLPTDTTALNQLLVAHPEWGLDSVGLQVFGGPLNRPEDAGMVVTIHANTRTRAAPDGHVAISRALARRLLASRPDLLARVRARAVAPPGDDGPRDTLRVVYGYGFSLGFYNENMVTVVDSLPPGDWLTDAAPRTEHPFDAITHRADPARR